MLVTVTIYQGNQTFAKSVTKNFFVNMSIWVFTKFFLGIDKVLRGETLVKSVEILEKERYNDSFSFYFFVITAIFNFSDHVCRHYFIIAMVQNSQ